MGQDCSVYSAWMGHCHWTEMLTGEVIVGLLTVIVAIVGVRVAVKQIQKQEELTRDQLKKQEELTRQQIDAMMKATQEQIAATMEATQQQLRKAYEPELEVYLSQDGGGLNIELFNFKNVPVPVKRYSVQCTYLINDIEEIKTVDSKDLNIVLRMGESTSISLSTDELWNYFKTENPPKRVRVWFYVPGTYYVQINETPGSRGNPDRMWLKAFVQKNHITDYTHMQYINYEPGEYRKYIQSHETD